MAMALERWAPFQSVTQDTVTVAIFALFAIAFIPVTLIWFYASRIARIITGIMVALKLSAVPGLIADWQSVLPIDLLLLALPTIAFALLFTPPAHRWIGNSGRHETNAFA